MEIFETIMIDAGRKIFRDSVSRAGTQIFKNGKTVATFNIYATETSDAVL